MGHRINRSLRTAKSGRILAARKSRHPLLRFTRSPGMWIKSTVFVATPLVGHTPTSFRDVSASRSTRSAGMGLFWGKVMPVLLAFSPTAAMSSA